MLKYKKTQISVEECVFYMSRYNDCIAIMNALFDFLCQKTSAKSEEIFRSSGTLKALLWNRVQVCRFP